MRARAVAASVLALSLMRAAPAVAEESPEDQALATALFKEARALLEEGKVAEACPKLAESQRLHAAGGTLLNLAVCHEREGKIATAWAELREARVVAERDGRADRVQLADDHAKALEARLSFVVLRVAAPGDADDLEVRLDERPVRRPAWGTAIPVDPGSHVVEATASRKKPFRVSVDVDVDGDRKNVDVVLVADEGARPLAISAPPTAAPVRGETPGAPSSSSPPARDRTAAMVVGGVGLGAIALGSYFGLRAIAKHDDAQEACTTNPCGVASRDATSSAKTLADASTVTFAVGLAAVGVGVCLWLFTGHGAATRDVRLGPGRGTLDLAARF